MSVFALPVGAGVCPAFATDSADFVLITTKRPGSRVFAAKPVSRNMTCNAASGSRLPETAFVRTSAVTRTLRPPELHRET